MATIEFLRWAGGGVCTVIFMSNLTTVLRLCCVVVGVGTIIKKDLARFSTSLRIQDTADFI